MDYFNVSFDLDYQSFTHLSVKMAAVDMASITKEYKKIGWSRGGRLGPLGLIAHDLCRWSCIV